MPSTDMLYVTFERIAIDVPLLTAKMESEWNEWNDSTHITDVCKTIGAHTATRWKITTPGIAQYASVYEIEGGDGVRGLDRLRAEWPKWWAAGRMHPRHKTIQSALVRTLAEYDPATGHLYRKRPQSGSSQRLSPKTKALHLIFSSSNDPAKSDEWNEWYMYTHSPEAIKTGAFVRATRFERILPEPVGGNMEVFFSHLTIYDVERDEKLPPIDWPTIEKDWEARGLYHPNHTGAPGFMLKPAGRWAAKGYHP